MSMLFLRFFWLPSHYISISYQPFIHTNQPTYPVTIEELNIVFATFYLKCHDIPSYLPTYLPYNLS